jgi:hypothetical protein
VSRGWKSNHPDLKDYVFEEGTAEKAGQFTRSMKEIIEWIRKSDRREAENIATKLENEAQIIIAAPPPPEGEEDLANPGQRLPPDAVEVAIHQQEIQLIAKRRSSLREGRLWAYAILKGQCSPSTWGKIQSEAGFDAIDAAKDHIELKRRIKGVCCGFERHKQPVYALAQAIVLLATMFQENNELLDTYFRNFKA